MKLIGNVDSFYLQLDSTSWHLTEDQPLDRVKVEGANHCVWIRVSGGDAEITLMAGKPGKGPLRFVDSYPCQEETASRVGQPDVCVGGNGCWCEGPYAPNSEIGYRIPEPSFAADSARIY